MTQSIVVAIDGSDIAERALDKAISLAKAFDASLTIVHVLLHGRDISALQKMAEVELSAESAPSVDLPLAAAGLLNAYREKAAHEKAVVVIGDYLTGKAANQARAAGVKTVTTRIEDGEVSEAINRVITSVDADTMVMGSRGLGGVKEFLLGSVSHEICQKAPCTVVIVK